MILEIIAHAKYGKKHKRAGVNAEVHFFVDDSKIPREDITPERLQRAFKRWLATKGDAGEGFKIDLIEWQAGDRTSDEHDGTAAESLNDGLRGALRQGKLDFSDEETE